MSDAAPRHRPRYARSPSAIAADDAARRAIATSGMLRPMSDDPEARLDPLRAALGEIDREILALVARRQAVAQRIGQVKRDIGIPTRDYLQEKDVVERARAAAVEHGLSAALGEELILALIRGSLTVQEKDTVAATGEGGGRRVLVIAAPATWAVVRALSRCPGLRGRDRRSVRRP